jgi:drug/metabolite transporter (DMT)-like permease
MSRLQASILLLVCAVIWGTTFVAQKAAFLPGAAGPQLGPLGFTGLRFLLGATIILPFAWREARRAGGRLAHADRRGFAWCTLSLTAGAVTQQIGIIDTTVTNSGFLTALYVPLVPIVSLALLARPAHWVVWPAAAGSLVGTYLLGGAGLDQFNAGDAWVALSAVFWALQVTLVGVNAARSGRPLALAVTQFAGCGLMTLAAALALEGVAPAAIRAAGPELLYAGGLSVGIAFSLQVVGQRYTHPAVAAIIMSSEAVFAALAAAMVLGESLSPLGWGGAVLILSCLVAVEAVPAFWPPPGQTAATGIIESHRDLTT